jgi:hypothetical protein
MLKLFVNTSRLARVGCRACSWCDPALKSEAHITTTIEIRKKSVAARLFGIGKYSLYRWNGSRICIFRVTHGGREGEKFCRAGFDEIRNCWRRTSQAYDWSIGAIMAEKTMLRRSIVGINSAVVDDLQALLGLAPEPTENLLSMDRHTGPTGEADDFVIGEEGNLADAVTAFTQTFFALHKEIFNNEL